MNDEDEDMMDEEYVNGTATINEMIGHRIDMNE